MGRGPAYHGNGVDIIWVGDQNNMDRGSKCHRHLIHHRRGVTILLIGVQYAMSRGFNIPWREGLRYHV
jgi:hypothetical protein